MAVSHPTLGGSGRCVERGGPTTVTYMTTRLAIFGDIGGHADAFADRLRALGADPETGTVPTDLIICQLGDLIHRGPDSVAVIELVDRFRHASPDRWVQLVGNHESLYLRTPVFHWSEALPETSVAILRDWWASGWSRLAASFTTTGLSMARRVGTGAGEAAGGLLVSHAGLTAGLWDELGRPGDVADMALCIDVDARRREHPDDVGGVWRPGRMLVQAPRRDAGVLWAEACGEVYDSWLDAPANAPVFHQVHGHSVPYFFPGSFDGFGWRPPLRQRIAEGHNERGPYITTAVDVARRHTRVSFDGRMFVGIDPGHGTRPQSRWEPLVVTLAPAQPTP